MADLAWWQRTTVYQIYPRSFRDSNGDGIGDIAGICQRLDYLVELGVDALWLSPFFPSPMADFGYDIADYAESIRCSGRLPTSTACWSTRTRADCKIVLDLVPNHTSDQHPWFQESRARARARQARLVHLARSGARRRAAQQLAVGVRRRRLEVRRAHRPVLLSRLPRRAARPELAQPRRPRGHARRRALLARRGVDGFRVDVIWHLLKDDQFRDNPPNPNFQPRPAAAPRRRPAPYNDRPEVHEAIAELRRVLDEFRDRVLIGEIYLPIERLVAYYGRELGGTHLPFNFSCSSAPWHARTSRS